MTTPEKIMHVAQVAGLLVCGFGSLAAICGVLLLALFLGHAAIKTAYKLLEQSVVGTKTLILAARIWSRRKGDTYSDRYTLKDYRAWRAEAMELSERHRRFILDVDRELDSAVEEETVQALITLRKRYFEGRNYHLEGTRNVDD